MSNSKGPSSMRNMMLNGRNSLLPPKSPFPSTAPSFVDYIPSSVIGQKGTIKAREGYSNHQRTSSESLVIEEQPSWLDELLNEPETPVRRGGHRRSSSDSFAYIDAANAVGADYVTQDDIRFHNMMPVASWGSQEVDHYRDAQRPFVPDFNAFGKYKNRAWDASTNSFTHLRGFPPSGNILQNSGMSRAQQESEVFPSTASDKHDGDSGPQDLKGSSEKKDLSNGKPSASETDSKRAKQQFAQRSRVRKLQYIAELERNVQALQAEGSEVSAELEFLNQQHLILSMENKALKQRLESLAQEQLIKYVEHEVLERELGRLRSLYHQQQQPQPLQQQSQQHQTSGHRRSSSKDLDLQLANLSLKQKDTSSARVDVPRQLNI
ncbi:OLC1v1002360C1 [Oldenlandia corymbosa var. corymbosa]|uniref:OLC1v1002360C1 n=1 Tax=Oldenlandia corymbosa var. corymbosa TaxID=529605 RepID=A0AAV1DAC6_OLDCO|nr:OLC1v1002360C1 [Oldenlandia corymbosa var. corymbosa]